MVPLLYLRSSALTNSFVLSLEGKVPIQYTLQSGPSIRPWVVFLHCWRQLHNMVLNSPVWMVLFVMATQFQLAIQPPTQSNPWWCVLITMWHVWSVISPLITLATENPPGSGGVFKGKLGCQAEVWRAQIYSTSILGELVSFQHPFGNNSWYTSLIISRHHQAPDQLAAEAY